MAYDYRNELSRVRNYYRGDPLQKRFSALITGCTGAGKTYLLKTCRRPIHVDSFDPGGTKCLIDEIRRGDIIADTQWETEDPFNPDRFAIWKKAVDVRLQIGYFDLFGTYCLDSATTWGEAILGYGMKEVNKAGEAPKWSRDYVPQKVAMVNYIRKLMNLKCDFILTGHLRENEEILSIDTKTGIVHKRVEYRFFTVGQAVITIPLLFDEIYVLLGEGDPRGGNVKRELLLDAQGKYMARSRLRANGRLEDKEPPDIRAILKKIGMPWEDKAKLDLTEPPKEEAKV